LVWISTLKGNKFKGEEKKEGGRKREREGGSKERRKEGRKEGKKEGQKEAKGLSRDRVMQGPVLAVVGGCDGCQ